MKIDKNLLAETLIKGNVNDAWTICSSACRKTYLT